MPQCVCVEVLESCKLCRVHRWHVLYYIRLYRLSCSCPNLYFSNFENKIFLCRELFNSLSIKTHSQSSKGTIYWWHINLHVSKLISILRFIGISIVHIFPPSTLAWNGKVPRTMSYLQTALFVTSYSFAFVHYWLAEWSSSPLLSIFHSFYLFSASVHDWVLFSLMVGWHLEIHPN